MKKLTFASLLFAFCFANAVVSTVPSSFSVVTYAINNFATSPYTGEPWQHNLSTPVKASNALVSSFQSSLSDKYGSSVAFSYKKNHDSQATKARFTGTESNNYNFVYVDTHGNVDLIAMQPYGELVRNTEKAFAGKTYWAMFTSCLVFKKREMHPAPWFNGIHSILGYSSSFGPYEDEKYTVKVKCGVFNLSTCTRTRTRSSYYVQEQFAENWIKDEQSIWESFKNAVNKWMVEGRNYGIEPVITYLRGTVDGKSFAGLDEKFASSIQKPIYNGNGLELVYTWHTFGTPSY